MKNLFFSFLMMLALVVVAGSAMAQTKTTPYKGGTYSYALGGIEVNTTGYAVITYSGSDAAIKNVEGSSIAYVADTKMPVVSGSTFVLNFDIAYGDAAGLGTITVVVTDGAIDGCSNQITWSIVPATAPTLDLVISTTATTPYCQAVTGTENNVDAATGSENTIDYTINPTTAAGTGYAYDFTLAVTPSAFGIYTIVKKSGTGTVSSTGLVTGANGAIVISATWTTTTGLAKTDIVGTISASTLHVSAAEGGDYITGTQTTNTATVAVKSTPTIGIFN